MKNFYVTFSLLLRAFNKSADRVAKYNIDSGNPTEDLKARQLLNSILNKTTNSCDAPFREDILFRGSNSAELLEDVRGKFYNISRIMD